MSGGASDGARAIGCTRGRSTASRDADSFDADLKRRARMGDLDLLDAGRETLATSRGSGGVCTPS
jgi:hypothetical protein